MTTDTGHKLKISIPVELKKYGGFYTFLANFIRYLEKEGIPYTNRIEGDEDILFINSWVVPYKVVKKAKKKNPKLKVLHRIDGSAQDYGRTDNADQKQSKINKLADLTVFQSEYGKYATMRKFRVIGNDGPVIYNPVDIETFTPEGKKTDLGDGTRICCATFSTNRKKGLDSIYRLAEHHTDLNFVMCGRTDSSSLKNIRFMGMLDKPELSRIMRSCDLFLFPSENETCSNVVLEAMASGLPVLYRDSGGTSEIVGDAGRPMGDDFGSDVHLIMSEHKEISKRARKRTLNMFNPDIVFDHYIKAVLEAERKPVNRFFDFMYIGGKCRK